MISNWGVSPARRTDFDVDSAWLVANVLAVMNSDDTFQIHAETSAGTADLTVTNKYSA